MTETESAILGCFLAYPDQSGATISQLLRPEHFTGHYQALYRCLLELHAEGKPVDFLSVATLAKEKGILDQIGGAPKITDLQMGAVAPAAIKHHAKQLKDDYAKRKLKALGARAIALADSSPVNEALSTVAMELDEIGQDRAEKSHPSVKELVQQAVARIQERAQGKEGATGVSTGIHSLNVSTGGIRRGSQWVLAGPAKGGKALAVTTPIATPNGWTTMGEIQPGDTVFTEDGSETMVVAVSPVMRNRRCYRLKFSDGASITADEDHLWKTRIRTPAAHSEFSIRTTRAIWRSTLFDGPVHVLPGGKSIVSCKQTKSVPVRCIQVEHPSGMFLAGKNMVPTHNSSLALCFLRALAVSNHQRCAFYGLEMPSIENVERLICSEGNASAQHLRDGMLGEHDYRAIMNGATKVAGAPIHFRDDIFSLSELTGNIRQLKTAHPDLFAVFVDYAQLLSTEADQNNREREVATISRTLRTLGMQLDLCMIILSQVNDDGRLRESRALGMDATKIVFIEIADEPGVRSLRLIQRDGPSETIEVAYIGDRFQFADLQRD